jgi:hypothetical protein
MTQMEAIIHGLQNATLVENKERGVKGSSRQSENFDVRGQRVIKSRRPSEQTGERMKTVEAQATIEQKASITPREAEHLRRSGSDLENDLMLAKKPSAHSSQGHYADEAFRSVANKLAAERRRRHAPRLSAKNVQADLVPIESLGLVGTSLMSAGSLSKGDVPIANPMVGEVSRGK